MRPRPTKGRNFVAPKKVGLLERGKLKNRKPGGGIGQ